MAHHSSVQQQWSSGEPIPQGKLRCSSLTTEAAQDDHFPSEPEQMTISLPLKSSWNSDG